MAHKCFTPACNATVASHLAFCGGCWRKLPVETRQSLTRAAEQSRSEQSTPYWQMVGQVVRDSQSAVPAAPAAIKQSGQSGQTNQTRASRLKGVSRAI